MEGFDSTSFLGEELVIFDDPADELLYKAIHGKSGDTALEPEKRLMLAVLEDAIGCVVDYYCLAPRHASDTEKYLKLYGDAEEWLLDDSESERLFSFRNICETLGFDPGYLRKGIGARIAKIKKSEINTKAA